MTPLRFGVVGCGGFSTVYQLPALRRCSRVHLAAVVDLDQAWAQKVARRFRVPAAHTDYHALIGRVDAVLIATPNTTHADIACTLLQHGIHVLCEKPLATTRADVERMFNASAQTGARLMAAYCFRFSPNLTMLKRILAAQWLGSMHEIAAEIGGRYEEGEQRTDFRKNRRLSGGGVLIDLGIHIIDLALWLSDELPRTVAYASASAQGWEVESDAEVALDFPSGSRATLACSFAHVPQNAVTVQGSAGWARVPLYEPTHLTLFSERARVCQQNGAQHLVFPGTYTWMYDRQIEHFCDAVMTGKDFIIHAAEVGAALDVIECCYRREQNP